MSDKLRMTRLRIRQRGSIVVRSFERLRTSSDGEVKNIKQNWQLRTSWMMAKVVKSHDQIRWKSIGRQSPKIEPEALAVE